MNVVTYSAAMEKHKHDLVCFVAVFDSAVRRKWWEGAKDACDKMRHIVRQMELLEIQHKEEG